LIGASEVDQSFEKRKQLVVSKVNITIDNSKLKSENALGSTQRSSNENRKLHFEVSDANKTEPTNKKQFGQPPNTISLKDLFPPE